MRIINAPGIEIHEYDRSNYEEIAEEFLGTAVFSMGFTDKGVDYETKYTPTLKSYIETFGYPKNEAERYSYNNACEVFNRGGTLYMTKLPYDNKSYNKYPFVTYKVDADNLNILSTPYEVLTNNYGIFEKLKGVHSYDFMLMPNIDLDYIAEIKDEQIQRTFETEDEKKIFQYEDNDTINFIEFFNDNNIDLSVVHDFFDTLQDKINFPYQTYTAFKFVFYKENGKCKNEAVYILSDLNYMPENDFMEKYQVPQYYSSEITDMKNQILEFGDFMAQKEIFGKNKTFAYYKTYLKNLLSKVNSLDESFEKELMEQLIEGYINDELMKTKYTDIKNTDSNLTSYIKIDSYEVSSNTKSGLLDIKNLDKFRTSELKAVENEIVFVDITRNKYESDYAGNQIIGICPIITTAANALYFQRFIENSLETESDYNITKDLQNVYSDNKMEYCEYETSSLYDIQNMVSALNNDSPISACPGFVQNFGSEKKVYISENEETLSRTAASFFPMLKFMHGRIDPENIKNIGIVVMQVSKDASNDNKIQLKPLETFVGSLDSHKSDSNGSTIFIDRIINSTSKYINCFSNVKFSNDSETLKLRNTDIASLFVINNQSITSMGFYASDTKKFISVKTSINDAIDLIFSRNQDINSQIIDILVDAGVSNIGQFIQSVYKTKKGYYDIHHDKSYLFKCESFDDTKQWLNVINKYDNFCKNVRKDCMFVADGVRPSVLTGNQKLIRDTKPKNTIENTVIQKMKYMSGMINTSYGAGYSNWFYMIDKYSGNYFWCPPSIVASGVYVYTDDYYNYWSAPAGLNRGKMQNDIVDISYNPSNVEAGKVYNNYWNYAINYPIDGIVLEGQKTFQREKTALDRVNVRRLMLGLEKEVRYVAKYFVYEGITNYMMQKFVDSITPIFENVKNKGGILEYAIMCDERNNNTQTIENNELHCTIAVKPVKTLEFLVLNFIATSQGASVSEIDASQL